MSMWWSSHMNWQTERVGYPWVTLYQVLCSCYWVLTVLYCSSSSTIHITSPPSQKLGFLHCVFDRRELIHSEPHNVLRPHIPIAESLLRMSASSCYYYDPHPRTDGKKILPGGGWGWSHIFSAGDKDPENTQFILTLTAEMVIKDFAATEQNRRQ